MHATPWLRCCACLLLVAGAVLADARADEFRIGVLSFRDKAQTANQWQPTANRLGEALPGNSFRIVAMHHAELDDAVANKRVNFVITNPEHYIRLEALHQVTRIATVVREENGVPLTHFAGAIVAKASRSEITQPSDLKGLRVAAVEPFALGAFLMQADTLLDLGIDARRDLNMRFVGLPQDRCIDEVLSGRADAAFVRAGVVEQMEREGKLARGELKVIGQRADPPYPYAHSTQLMPEWPLATLPHTEPELANRVAAQLLLMPPGTPAARAGRYLRWAVPVSYEPVESLMRRLGAPPFDKPSEFSPRDVMRKYALEISLVLLLAAAAAFATAGRILTLNRRLRQQVGLVSERSRELEQEVHARAAVEDKLRLHARVFSDAQECLLITDAERNIVAINDAALAVTGYSREELLGRNPSVFKSGQQDEEFYRRLWQQIDRDGYWSGEVWNRRKDGRLYACILKISELRDEQGRLTHYIGSQEDITALKETQRSLERMARFDSLTGLPNRNLLHDRMEQALAVSRRGGQQVAVCLLDLDGFKAVNDSLGHEAGDRLLVDIAARLLQALRETDTVARLGGDEFVLLLSGIDGLDHLAATLERVLAATRIAVPAGGRELAVSSSIGVTLYPDDNAAAETLLRHADEAMYHAKRQGRNRYHLFDAASDSAVAEYRELMLGLERAVADGQLRVHYQPIVHLPTGEIHGFEALVRWQHPQRGLLAPAHFLPAVEHSPIICTIDRWVMARALDDLGRWLAAGRDWYVSVNVAAFHFESPGFAAAVGAMLASRPDIAPHRLQLELLESKALVSLDAVRDIIRECRALGVHTALDDFGTGYASLAYFKRLPVNTLKIDPSFVRGIEDDAENIVIVDNIVRLTRSFQRDIVAEGMENIEIGRVLCRFGCHHAQGYGIARPMPADDVLAWAAAYRPDPSWSTAADMGGDLSIVVVENEMLTWVREVLACIESGGKLAIPEREVADTRWCQYGRWLNGDGQMRYSGQAGFAELVALHERMHRLGWQAIVLVRAGRHDEARAVYGELERAAADLKTRTAALRQT